MGIIDVLSKYQSTNFECLRDKISAIRNDYVEIRCNKSLLKCACQQAKEEIKCNVKECNFMKQHLDQLRESNDQDRDDAFVNLMNNIHCNLVHPTTKREIEPENVSKFNITVHCKQTQQPMDQLLDVITNKVSSEIVAKFLIFVQNDEYDTDAVEMDVYPPGHGNINSIHEGMEKAITDYFYLSKCMLPMFVL